MPELVRPTLREYLESIRGVRIPSPNNIEELFHYFVSRETDTTPRKDIRIFRRTKFNHYNYFSFYIAPNDMIDGTAHPELGHLNYLSEDSRESLPREIQDAGNLALVHFFYTTDSDTLGAYAQGELGLLVGSTIENMLEAIKFYRARELEGSPIVVADKVPQDPKSPGKNPDLTDVDHIVERFKRLDLD